MKRTLREIIKMAGRKKDYYYCEHAPLLFIDLHHVIEKLIKKSTVRKCEDK